MKEKDTLILEIDPVEPQQNKVEKAAKFIRGGGLVIFPTETVYGIGANAMDDKAASKIFEVKGRPPDNPLIVHVSSYDMAEKYARMPAKYADKIRRAWPSPLTFIVESRGEIPSSVLGGLDTVTVRMPAHPVALSLIKAAKCPIAAPSANPSKKPTATNAKNAIYYFNGKVDCIIDSGPAFFGVESTIIDLRDFTILRPGPFSVEEIEKAFGERPLVGDVALGKKMAADPISPGTKYKHYAPDTALFMYNGNAGSLIKILDQFDDLPPFAFIGSAGSCNVMSSELGISTVSLGRSEDYYEIAKNLFDSLILLDSLKVSFAIVESFKENGIGLAIMNRLRKACSGREFSNLAQFRKYVDTLK